MTKFKAQGFNNTFKNARKGFRLVLKSEMNIRIHVAIATFVVFMALFLKFSAIEFCLLLFVIGLVIVAEMLNTAIEFTLDSIYHNRYSRMVGITELLFINVFCALFFQCFIIEITYKACTVVL